MAIDFVHLHVHSVFSLLDGACPVAELPRRAVPLRCEIPVERQDLI